MSARTLVSGRNSGFTLIEVLISVLVFGLLLTGALGFMSSQYSAFQGGVDRMTALQTARFAILSLEEDLRTAGTNVPGGQPALVYAGDDVIAFSANYATNVDNDPFAVFYDPDAPSGQVAAPTTELVIPNASFTFPDTIYRMGPALSPAELIMFFFKPDLSTSRTDDYALYRKVNGGTPELVARNLLEHTSAPFFRYMRETLTNVDSIADSGLPLMHFIPIHLSAADTGAVARIDSIRGVRVSMRATNGLSGTNERIAELTRVVRFDNVEFGVMQSCGSAPILGQALGAALSATPTGEPAINLTWARGIDEAAGEGDVIRYVIWKRVMPSVGWDEPYLSIPAGQPNYTYQDAVVERGVTYQFGLAAQDCTPALSPITQSVTITIP